MNNQKTNSFRQEQLQCVQRIQFIHKKFTQVKGKSFFLAGNNTMIVFQDSKQSKYVLRHIDFKGKKIESIKLEDQLLDFGMLGKQQYVTITQNQQQKFSVTINVWDLKSHKMQNLCHQLNYIYYSTVLFSQTSLICIVQYQKKDKNMFKISYYRFTKKKTIQLLSTHIYILGQQNIKKIKILKLNKHSMIGFFQESPFSQNYIKFYTFRLGLDLEGEKKNTYLFQYQFNPQKSQYLSSRLKDAWCLKSQRFYFQIETFIETKKVTKLNSKLISKFMIQNLQYFERIHDFLWAQQKGVIQKINILQKQRHFIQFHDDLRQLQFGQSDLLNQDRTNKRNKNQNKGFQVFYLSSDNLKVMGCQQMHQQCWANWSEVSFQMVKLMKKQKQQKSSKTEPNKFEYLLETYITPHYIQARLIYIFLLNCTYQKWQQNLLYEVIQILTGWTQ